MHPVAAVPLLSFTSCVHGICFVHRFTVLRWLYVTVIASSLQKKYKTELKTLVPVCREHTLVPPVGPLRPPNVERRVVRWMYAISLLPILYILQRVPRPSPHYISSIVARLRIPSLLYQGSNPVSIQRTSRTTCIGPTGPGNSGPTL